MPRPLSIPSDKTITARRDLVVPTKLFFRSEHQRVVKTRKHARLDAIQSALQLETALGPVLQQFDAIVKLDQADAIVGLKSRRKSLRGATKVVEIVRD